MSFNGSGVFVVNSTGQPVSSNTLIEASVFNAFTADVATGLSTAITRDGQTTVTADLPMSGQKHTGVGNASARTQYAAAGQVQDGLLNWVDGGGTADAITAAYSPVITALVDGQVCYVRATAANATTTPTFSPNGLTARTIVKSGGGALAAGNISGDGHELILRYDLANTRWELLNPVITLATLDSPTKGGIQAQTYTAYTTGGSDTAYTLTPTPAIAALAENQEFDVEFHAAAGATPTLAISGLTAKALKYRNSAGTLTAVTSTQIPSGWRSKVTYDGTDYIVREIPPAAAVSQNLVQVVEATPITALTTITGVIPADDTIPQNTEGDEVITVSITPTSATNRLRIEFNAPTVGTSSSGQVTAALFQDSTAGALAASGTLPSGVSATSSFLTHEMAAGTTSATTFKIRVGVASNTAYINGVGGGTRLYGGVAAARLRVTEIKV